MAAARERASSRCGRCMRAMPDDLAAGAGPPRGRPTGPAARGQAAVTYPRGHARRPRPDSRGAARIPARARRDRGRGGRRLRTPATTTGPGTIRRAWTGWRRPASRSMTPTQRNATRIGEDIVAAIERRPSTEARLASALGRIQAGTYTEPEYFQPAPDARDPLGRYAAACGPSTTTAGAPPASTPSAATPSPRERQPPAPPRR